MVSQVVVFYRTVIKNETDLLPLDIAEEIRPFFLIKREMPA